MRDIYNIILHCPECGKMFKVALTKNGYKTDYNDHFTVKGDKTKCVSCGKSFNVPDNRIISEDWICNLVFKIKGN